MKIRIPLATVYMLGAFAILCTITACGGQIDSEDKNTATTENSASDPNLMTPAQFDAYRQSRTVDKVFQLAGGSSGNGVIMTELKKSSGLLNDPSIDIAVYDTDTNLSSAELKDQISQSLESGKTILLDSKGTSTDREKVAQLSYNAIGASVDASAVMIAKAPQGQPGYTLTPIYTVAEVQQQVAQGLITDASKQTNTAKSIFIYDPNSGK